MPANPYLSVVVAARNDNHGGDMLVRMQAFLDSWIALAQRYHLSSEIIIVEWNPPAGRPRLIADLHWPADSSSCEIRFVEVPREIHERFAHADVIPLHQMIAKNVGIRRARGQFVLATNLDIIFSAAMMQFLAERRLTPGTMYRVDRLDIANHLPKGGGVDELLSFCENNVLRVFAREGDFNLDAGGLPEPRPDDVFAADAGIRLVTGWHAIERSDFDSYRWIDPEARFLFQRPADAAPRLVLDVEAGPSAGADPVTLEVVGPDGRVLTSASLTGRAMLRLHLPPELSAGCLALRVNGRGLPLLRDPRILHLRVLGMAWEAAPEWLQSPAVPRETNQAAEPPIRVLSTTRRQIQFAVRPRPGAELRSFDVDVRDAAGNVVFQAARQSAGEHLVTLNFDFEASANLPASSAWLLEMVRAKPAQDWSASYHALHPLAARIPRAAYLHTHACGDFTLLARDDWFRLRGYAEFPIWPMHIDALFCYAAYHAGIQEEILRHPLRIFHIEHLTAAGWTPEGEAARSARLAAKGLSEMKYSEFTKWVNQMRRLNAPLIFTLRNWGLGDVDLKQVLV
uniref:Uncharacterized protein n=1 Tax=Solibacter usitatus (strain Ellin6076) TaxID=234267 RepID=Q02BJ7_SOLUE